MAPPADCAPSGEPSNVPFATLLLGSNGRRTVDRRSNSTGRAPSRPIGWRFVPTSSGGSRAIAVLDPADELPFSRSVVSVAPRIQRALGGESHANRLAGWDPHRGPILEPWTHARLRWSRAARRLGNDADSIAVTDVRACYASIGPAVIVHRLRTLGAPREQIDGIASWLYAFGDAGVQGLPVGPAASALLADAVLEAGDDALRASGVGFIRWVDDVMIFAPDRKSRARALDDLREAWAALGLQIHEGKTALFDDLRDLTASARTMSNAPSAASALR